MAAKGKKSIPVRASGLDQRWKGKIGGGEDISPARIDPDGLGWLFDRGIEPWFDPDTGFSAQSTSAELSNFLGNKIDSVYVWTKQNTNQTYYLVEQGGFLYYLWGNKGTTGASGFYNDFVLLDSNRHVPKVNEAGTQYIPYGNRLLIINGVDKPLWFYGRTKTRDFGFLIQTPSPQNLDIEPQYWDGTTELQTGTASPAFATTYIGLGDDQANDVSVFGYKMSYIRDTGAESPLSAPTFVNWEIPSGVAGATKRFGVFLNDLPTGKDGTVARRIYRTKNQRLSTDSNAQDQVYYLVKQINDNSTESFIDVIPDQALINDASSLDSVTIDTSYQYGAAWNGRLWLAGGVTHPTRIIYSKAGIPEQFGLFDYFDVGNTTGGSITQIFPYYNNLLVFREHSIEVIRSTSTGFTISQVSPSIGTTGSNTIQLVPEIGVVFLSENGFYVLAGGLDGGSSITITKASKNIGKEIDRVSVAALPRAVSCYSPKEKEYWCHYPPKGSKVPKRGIVLHSDTAEFSLRHAYDKTKDYQWKFTAMAVDPSGNIILGTEPTWTLAGSPSDPLTVGAVGELCHLHVWSGAPYWGKQLTVSTVVDDVYTYTASEVALDQKVWQSNWTDFGNPGGKNRVFSVEVEMISYGDNEITLEWGFDYDSTWNTAGSQKPAKSELVFTTSEDPVLGPADGTVTKNPFTIGTSALKSPRVIRLRWDVNTKLVDNFRFRLLSDEVYHVLSIDINYDDNNQTPLNQRARSAPGQPW